MPVQVSRFGFTLAEVLVTLGIIGVVSAMTVPTLMQNHQRKTYVTQLHKSYNELSQALLQYQTDKNAVNLTEAGLTTTAAIQSFVKNYYKIVSECDTMTSPCFADSYKNLNGTVENSFDATPKSYVIASGAAIRPLYSNADGKIFNMAVDINGQQGPNIVGRDLFFMGVYNNGTIDTWVSGSSVPLTDEQRSKASGNWLPFANILNDNWEMTY